jgi:hypothetical protein
MGDGRRDRKCTRSVTGSFAWTISSVKYTLQATAKKSEPETRKPGKFYELDRVLRERGVWTMVSSTMIGASSGGMSALLGA